MKKSTKTNEKTAVKANTKATVKTKKPTPKITFDNVWKLLENVGNGKCVSSTGAEYELVAKTSARDNTKRIIAKRNKIAIYIRKEDWGKSENKNGVRIGGIFNGKPSIFDWYSANK
jgi:hypothetical protein